MVQSERQSTCQVKNKSCLSHLIVLDTSTVLIFKALLVINNVLEDGDECIRRLRDFPQGNPFGDFHPYVPLFGWKAQREIYIK